MPEIRPVTKENWHELISLKVRDDQKDFVGSNLYSIAEAQFGSDYEGYSYVMFPFGIYDDNVPVGFLMYSHNYDHPRQQGFIFRLMVDEKYQGKGYGRFGMEKLLEIFRADELIKEVGISYKPQNSVARKLYASFGFIETGEMLGEEILAVLQIRP